MPGMTVRFLPLIVALALASEYGCAALRIKDDDSAGIVAAKVTGRITQGILTLGFSEVDYARERRREANRLQWQAIGRQQVGKTIQNVILQLGPPTQMIPAGTDRIFVWSETQQGVLPGQSTTTFHVPSSPYSPPTATTTTTPDIIVRRTSHLMLTVGLDDVVRDWSYKE